MPDDGPQLSKIKTKAKPNQRTTFTAMLIWIAQPNHAAAVLLR